jgi:hypothetical protein
MTLAVTADVEALLQIDITDDDDPTVIRLLELATAIIEDEAGRSFDTTPIIAEAHTAAPHARAILLEHWPVASVEEVREAGTVLAVSTDYLIDLRAGILRRRFSSSTAYWEGTPAAIEVDYTPAVPAGLVALCAQVAARNFNLGASNVAGPSVMAGLRQLTIGRWSATKETGRAGNALGEGLTLSDAEVRIAHRYRDRRP